MFALTMIPGDKALAFTQAVKPTLEEAQAEAVKALGEGCLEEITPEWEWDGWVWTWCPEGWASFTIVDLREDGVLELGIS